MREESPKKKIIRFGILGAAILFLAAGAATGGFTDVMSKAVRICLECIGIG